VEQQVLRFALGLPSEPVYRDIKPIALPTIGERELDCQAAGRS